MINFSYIVLFHDNNSTDYVIDSILSQSIPGDEIIIVNDHSKSENLAMFQRFDDSVTLVHSDKVGNRGYNRNYGAKYAQNDYLLFVDGDMLFLPNAIYFLRNSMENGYVGAVGNIVCGDKTIPQMNLLTGVDYLNLVRTELSVENIIKLGFLYDKRQRHIYDKICLNSIWEYFYSGYCAVKKDVFDEIGGFDTEFVGWGVEDTELGYRLHLKGKLQYNNSAYAVHAPHMRNLYKCLVSNRINLYRFLAQYPTNEVAINMVLGSSIKVKLTIEQIRQHLFDADTHIYNYEYIPNHIYINELTRDYPNGYTCFVDKNCNSHILELFGLALPFRNNNFDVAVCTENIFIYPESFVAAIFTELLRISNEIRIIKIENPKRVLWSQELVSGLVRISAANRIVYTSTQINDFNVIDCGTYYKITDGISSILNENFYIYDNFYRPDLFEKQKIHYLAINLTAKEISSLEQEQIMNKYSIVIDNCYNLNINIPHKDIKLSNVLYGDIYRLHTPIIYIISPHHTIVKEDIWWRSCREKDIIHQKV